MTHDRHHGLFPEFAEPLSDSTGDLTQAAERRPLLPVLTDLDRLRDFLERETSALEDGNLDTFSRLQGEKRMLARVMERHAARPVPVAPGHGEAIADFLCRFETAVRRNEAALGAATEATRRLKSYAIEAIERENGDGLYVRGGRSRGQSSVSTAGVRVKL